MGSIESLSLFDTHCHVDYIAAGKYGHDAETDVLALLQKAKAFGVDRILNPGVAPAEWAGIAALALQHPALYMALAIHPCDAVAAVAAYPDWEERIRQYAGHPKLLAIGETGLDYYHHDPLVDAEQTAIQQACFRQSLALAACLDLPVIVHDREAHADVARLVDAVPHARSEGRGIMHCFSGDVAFAQEMVERGFLISFAGNLTFKKAVDLQAVAKALPLDCLLVETDAPFLSPVPDRGKPNEPYRTRFVAEFLAELKGLSVEAVARQTTENACRLFRLPTLAPAEVLA